MAASLYTGPSLCRVGSLTSGIWPSWAGEMLPPGNTCADAKEVEVFTRWRRRISFVGEKRRMLFDLALKLESRDV
jgi:hypothetical protein